MEWINHYYITGLKKGKGLQLHIFLLHGMSKYEKYYTV